MTAFLIFCW